MRKNVMPLKEAIANIYKDELNFIDDDNKKYFNDVLDHSKDILEYYKSFESLVKGLIDLNENNTNSNANEVMKTLTIVAAIFIPLSFIAGLFGMNFENMPELKWEYGYYYALGGMSLISVGMIIVMKVKKWF
jgi:magnesium transporter